MRGRPAVCRGPLRGRSVRAWRADQMRARTFAASAFCGVLTAAIVACATDENPSASSGPGPTTIPEPDGGSAVDVDAEAPPYVCAADELCPNDLFDSSRSGSLDRRTRLVVIRGR